MQISERIHRQTLGVVNWYLIAEGGKVTLVDAGTPGDWKLLNRALAERDLGLPAVEAVILTHAHADHLGFAERARSELGARVLTHVEEAPRARGGEVPSNEGGMTRYLLYPEAWRTVVSLMRRGGAKPVPVTEVAVFSHGEQLDIPGRPRVIHTPGHTEGSCALWFEDQGVLCSGDALVTHNVMTGRRGPQVMPAVFNVDSDQALESLDRLEPIPARVVAPGHGRPWEGEVSEAVEQARKAGRS